MRVVVAGSSGVIGSALVAALQARGDDVMRLVRPGSPVLGALWDPAAGTIDGAALEGADAVVNLAGRSIGARRWSDGEKRLLWESRVDATRLLAGTLAGLRRRPQVLLNASAVGYYGDGGDRVLTEADAPGDGYLARLCVGWEGATVPAAESGIRVVRIRSGIVLSASGGAIGRLLAPFGPRWLSPFRWGLGGPVGRGRQWWSWISLADEVRAIIHLLDHDVVGPVNLAAPAPATNRDFTKALGRVLRRPSLIPIPAFALRAMLGSELAEALVLEGQRAMPEVLVGSGFEFEFTDVEAALREALSRRG